MLSISACEHCTKPTHLRSMIYDLSTRVNLPCKRIRSPEATRAGRSVSNHRTRTTPTKPTYLDRQSTCYVGASALLGRTLSNIHPTDSKVLSSLAIIADVFVSAGLHDGNRTKSSIVLPIFSHIMGIMAKYSRYRQVGWVGTLYLISGVVKSCDWCWQVRHTRTMTPGHQLHSAPFFRSKDT